MLRFHNSGQYWQDRYLEGGTSGAGSYGRLAAFKAGMLNTFVAEHGIQTIIEFGCGDGAQLSLAAYSRYIGIDISREAVDLCKRKFRDDPSKTFLHVSEPRPELKLDLAISLDVIFHLVEDDTFNLYMSDLFRAACKFVIIYASNIDMPWPDAHVRHRQFGKWVDQHAPSWIRSETIKNPYPFNSADPNNTSFSDFYIYRSSTYPGAGI